MIAGNPYGAAVNKSSSNPTFDTTPTEWERWATIYGLLVATGLTVGCALGTGQRLEPWIHSDAISPPIPAVNAALLGLIAAAAFLHTARGRRLTPIIGWAGLLGTVVALLLARHQGAGLGLPTAIGLLLTASGIVLGNAGNASHPRFRDASLALVGLVVAASGSAILMQLAGMSLLITGDFKPAADCSTGALVSLGIALLATQNVMEAIRRVLLGTDASSATTPERLVRRRNLLTGIAGGSFVIVTLALGYLRIHLEQVRNETAKSLDLLAQLASQEIANWYAERIGDARTLREYPMLSAAVMTGTAEARQPLSAYLGNLRRNYRYRSVAIFDSQSNRIAGDTAASVEPSVGLSESDRALLARARQEREVFASEIHTNLGGSATIEFVAPIPGADGRSGAAILQADAGEHLLPIIRRPPMLLLSSEIHVLQSKGTNLIAFGRNGIVTIPGILRSKSSTRQYFPTAEDVSGPGGRLHEGLDENGRAVFGVLRPVVGSPWTLAVRLDLKTAFASARTETLEVGSAVTLAFSILGLGFGISWRRFQQRISNRQLIAERGRAEVAERLGWVMKHAKDALLVFSSDLRIVDASDRAEHFYGRSRAEMIGLTPRDLRAPSHMATIESDFVRASQPEGYQFETVHRRVDGSTFPVEVSASPVKSQGTQFVISIVRDITERRNQQKEIDRLGRLYRIITRIEQAIVKCRNQSELFPEICRILVEDGGFKIAWVGAADERSDEIVPLAVHGDAHGFVRDIKLSIHPQGPTGPEPSRIFATSGHTEVCPDVATDPAMAQWRPHAARSGIRSIIKLPLKRDGWVFGLLGACSEEPNFFGPQEVALLEGAAADISFCLGVYAGDERRRLAEHALRESESRMSFLLSATPAVIYSIHADGDFACTFISENIRKTLGYEPSAFIGHPTAWINRVHPDDLAAAFRSMTEAGAGDRMVREYRLRHADGSYRWILDEARLVRNSKGDPVEWVGYWFDYTERRRAEDALAEREEIFANIVGQAGDGIVLIDPETGRFLEFNTAAHESLGYTREEFAQLELRQVASLSSPTTLDKHVQQAMSTGYVEIESQHRTKSGEIRIVRINARKVVLRGRTRITSIWTDITERRRMEDRLRENEARYRLIADNTSDIIWFYDLTVQRFTYISPSVFRIRGFQPEDAMGNSLYEALEPKSAQWAEMELKRRIRAFEAGDTSVLTQTYELNLRRRDGTFFPAETSATLTRNEAGHVIGIVGVTRDITRRRETETRLLTLARAVEQSQASIVITDLAGRIEYVNPWFTHVTGYTFDEVRGRNPRILKSGETPAERYVELWRNLRAGREWRGELYNRKKNGERFVELAIISPVFGSSGEPTHYVAVKDDITDRKRVELELEALVRQLQVLRAVSNEVEQVKVPGQELAASVVRHLPHAVKSPAATTALIQFDGQEFRAGVGGEPVASIESDILVNGHRRGLVRIGHLQPNPTDASEIYTALEKDTVRAVAQTIGIGIGARESLEAVTRFNAELEAEVNQRTAELAARNREIEALLEAIPDMVLRMKPDGIVISCRRARNSPGLAAISFAADCPIQERVSQQLSSACLALGKRALASRSTVTDESEFPTQAGPIAVDLRASPVGSDDFVVFIRDISQRKRMEAETVAMLEKERQISEMKTRFISVTSHEFRTPMAAVVGSAELLANHIERLTPAKRREILDRILNSMHRMTEMLEDVLTLNRMDSKRTTVRPTPVDFHALILSTLEEVRVGDRGTHRFEAVGLDHSIPGVTDPNLFQHILTNLLSNAVRYSPAGTKVSVRATTGSDQLRIEVEDEGIGIPVADRARIFEPFERASNVGNIKGTGLGLNIVKRMTELIGGTVAHEDAHPVGTRFTVDLPLNGPPHAIS